jgi:hypothetical protein
LFLGGAQHIYLSYIKGGGGALKPPPKPPREKGEKLG